MTVHPNDGLKGADQGENIIPDNLKLVPKEEEKVAEKVRHGTIQRLRNIFGGEFYAEELAKSSTEQKISESELNQAVLKSLEKNEKEGLAVPKTAEKTQELEKKEPKTPGKQKETKEATPETPPKIPSMSVEKFLHSDALDKEKEKRIQQLASGKAYRFENGQRVQVSVKIEKDAQGKYKEKVTVTKTYTDGKTDIKEIPLSALKLQIWEREGKPSPLEQKQNKNVTYRHQNGTVTDKMTFLGYEKATGEYYFRKEPNGRPFTVAPQDVRVCRERNENGTIKEKGKFAITRKVAQEKPTDATKPTPAVAPKSPEESAPAATENPPAAGLEAGDDTNEEGSPSEGRTEDSENNTEGGKTSEDETEEKAADDSTEKPTDDIKQVRAALVQEKAGKLQRAWKGVKSVWKKLWGWGKKQDWPSAGGMAAGTAIGAGVLGGGLLGGGVGALAGLGAYRLGRWGVNKIKGWWKARQAAEQEEDEGEEEEEEEAVPLVKKGARAVPAAPKKAIPAKAAPATPRTPKGASAEDSEEPEFAHLDLDVQEQRTVKELRELEAMKRVACTVKGITYFGTLHTPLIKRGSDGKLYAEFVADWKENATTGKSEEDDTTIRVPIKEPGKRTEDAPDNDTHRKVPIASAKKIKSKTDADTGQGDNLFQFGGSAIAGKELREQQERYRAAEAAKRKKTAAEKATRDAAAKKKKDEENDFNERTLNGLATSQLRGVDLAAVQGQEELAKLATGENITDPQKRTEGELMKREGKRISIRVEDRIIYGNIPSPYLQEVTEKGQDKVYIENCVIREKDGTLRRLERNVAVYVQPETAEPVKEIPPQTFQNLLIKSFGTEGEAYGTRLLLEQIKETGKISSHETQLIIDNIHRNPQIESKVKAVLQHPEVRKKEWAKTLNDEIELQKRQRDQGD